MIRSICILTAVAVASAGSMVLAQVVVGGGAYPGFFPWGGNPYGGSTVAGSYMQGMSQVIQSQGAKNLMDSEAAINVEQARSMNLDNRLKGTNTYFEMRKINTAARESERSRGLSTEEAWRYAQVGVPKRMSPSELDPVTGRIHWPLVLEDPRYQEYRAELDKLFEQRENSHGSIGFEVYTKINTVSNQLLAALEKNIKDYSPNDYLQMKTFVQSLAYEAKFPTA